MPNLTDSLWDIPHQATSDDPPDVDALQKAFNQPIAALLQEPFKQLGYDLKSSDVLIRLDERVDNTADTFYANVRFIRYLRPDVLTRVHFQHMEWALILPQSDQHDFVIILDRFKLIDPRTQQVMPDWEGRRHMRVSSRPDYVLEHDGAD